MDSASTEDASAVCSCAGEFVLMNFHIGALRHEGQIPFRVMPHLSAVSEYKQELRLQIRAEFPDKFHGANVRARAHTQPLHTHSRLCTLLTVACALCGLQGTRR